ncbi:putative CRAL-TRIO lipid binding domain, CRAL/TRIO domain-containing protein [Lupinus albus]|uniref:Putative CRAL-TRIO lipid binding domain, CRAL/TRIO domain-containing protein n=1 Tax=Lupinus albus TaxID=3870 RepID=A0A6A4Q589_LUPAL|nr:putative CRAL-TRIO lipid binding domain, CRAL/TRIO domain-containing protein [Lupinus albus]
MSKEEEVVVDEASLLKDSTKEELTKIHLMRDFVQKRDPSSKEVDVLTLRRFLRARDLDVEKGSAMFLKYITWRRSFVPNGFISPSEIPDELAQGKMFVQGLDKIGRPVTVAFAAKHFQSKDGPDTFKRFVVFALDKLCSRMPPGQEKFLAIADIKGWGYANSDIRGYLNALTILQDYHPERLGKLFIVHAPYMFMKVWNVIYPFIDKNTKKKIVFVENKKLKETLLEDIDESQIPEIYGGKMPLVPLQD